MQQQHPLATRILVRFLVSVLVVLACTVLFGAVFHVPTGVWSWIDIIAYIGYWLLVIYLDKRSRTDATNAIKGAIHEAPRIVVPATTVNRDGMGYLAISQNYVVYKPKHGKIVILQTSDLNDYGYYNKGTGVYTSTEHNVGAMHVTNTREAQIRTFYCDIESGHFEWYTKSEKKLFRLIEEARGSANDPVVLGTKMTDSSL